MRRLVLAVALALIGSAILAPSPAEAAMCFEFKVEPASPRIGEPVAVEVKSLWATGTNELSLRWHTPNDRLVYDVCMRVRVVGYVRVSTEEQSASGLGLEAQRQAIRAEVVRRGWELAEVFEDRGASAKSMAGRYGLQMALRTVESGGASALLAAKLDRLSRSVGDFASLMERSRRKGWSIVALDIGLDTTTPSGEMMAHVVSSFSQYERRLIGQRTREALAVKRKQGVRLGRPIRMTALTASRIKRLRRAGHSFADIAAVLNGDGVKTAQGGRLWYPSTVRKTHLRLERTDQDADRGAKGAS